MSDTVAIVSVVVTGVGAPMIAAVTTRWQLRHAAFTERERERRDILDDATAKLAQLQRASGHCTALWRRGKTDDDDEVKDQLRSRNEAGERMLTAQGRICIRFGPDSAVAVAYGKAVDCLSRFIKVLDAFRRGEDYSAWKDRIDSIVSDVQPCIMNFLRVASEALQVDPHPPPSRVARRKDRRQVHLDGPVMGVETPQVQDQEEVA
jgi:hypothetical protein